MTEDHNHSASNSEPALYICRMKDKNFYTMLPTQKTTFQDEDNEHYKTYHVRTNHYT